ncbi:hypothetical protein IGI39_001094 [Enterococcus sp. AZ135]|uniref:amino acid permease n=1 Tax=unclassified Enterococcus TaxID=2608891 RepID=UPI003F28FE02
MRKEVSLLNLILIITTTVYSFSSMTTAFFMMGSKSLPWFLISACCYFIPYALIVAQYTKKYGDRSGSIYDWLKDSLSAKAAFVTAFLWYCSYFIWMISLFMKLTIPLSILLFGKDYTGQLNWFGYFSQFWIAGFSIIIVLLLTYMINQGFHTILSFLKISSYAMIGLLGLSLVSNVLIILHNPTVLGINLYNSFHTGGFFSASDNQLVGQLPFFIFSITAFGGLDTVASLADRTTQSRTRFPKAVIVSAGVIFLLYVCGIFLWSGASDLSQLRESSALHLGNLMYGLVHNMSQEVASALQLSANQTYLVTQFYTRYTALTMLLAYISLLSSITYGPLKSLIQGTPKELWPERFTRLNQRKMPEKALWVQAVLLILSIAFIASNNSFITELFNQLTYMTNVSRAIPYFIVAASFLFFLRKNIASQTDLFIQSRKVNQLLSLSVCVSIFIAILFQIYEPLKLGNYSNFWSLIIGPVIFSLFAIIIYQRFEKSFPAE